MNENIAQRVVESAIKYGEKQITLDEFLGELVGAIAELDALHSATRRNVQMLDKRTEHTIRYG